MKITLYKSRFSDSIAKLPLQFSPDDAWSYSWSMEVISRVIEVASGQSIDQYFYESVLSHSRPSGKPAQTYPESILQIQVSKYAYLSEAQSSVPISLFLLIPTMEVSI